MTFSPETGPKPDNEKSEFSDEWSTGPKGRGAFWTKEVGQKIDRNQENKKKEEERQMESSLQIPEKVQPGTADLVWYRIRNAIIINKKELERDPDNKTTQSILSQLNMQMDLLNIYLKKSNMLATEVSGKIQEWIKEMEGLKNLSNEEREKIVAAKSLLEMLSRETIRQK